MNYQKAPEHKFPVPFNDAWAGLTWVVAHAEELNVDPARIAVGGDSAGGNLAAAVAIKARESGGPALAFQLLIYPVTDRDLDTPSYIQNAEDYLLGRETMRWFWSHYADGATDEVDWRACPLRTASLADLPPAFVVTAEFDPLRDDGRRYADRLRDAGVKVTYTNYAGMIHGFYWMQAVVDRARDLHEEVAREVRAALRAEEGT